MVHSRRLMERATFIESLSGHLFWQTSSETIMKRISHCIVILVFIFGHGSLLAQNDTFAVHDTRIYAQRLDSISELGYPQDFGYMKSVADGIIKRDDVIIGGFGVYTLSNAIGDSALKIKYHDNLDVNIYKTYYYKNHELIYANVELRDRTSKQNVLYHKEEFYNNGKIVWAKTNETKKVKKYISRVKFSIYDDGLKFLDNFKKESNRH